jgi:hypothetical protein
VSLLTAAHPVYLVVAVSSNAPRNERDPSYSAGGDDPSLTSQADRVQTVFVADIRIACFAWVTGGPVGSDATFQAGTAAWGPHTASLPPDGPFGGLCALRIRGKLRVWAQPGDS